MADSMPYQSINWCSFVLNDKYPHQSVIALRNHVLRGHITNIFWHCCYKKNSLHPSTLHTMRVKPEPLMEVHWMGISDDIFVWRSLWWNVRGWTPCPSLQNLGTKVCYKLQYISLDFPESSAVTALFLISMCFSHWRLIMFFPWGFTLP